MTTKLHRGKVLYLAARLVELVDPLCRIETARADAGDHGVEAARVMAHLASAGSSTTDDLKLELGLETRGYHKVRRLLESRGAILSRSDHDRTCRRRTPSHEPDIALGSGGGEVLEGSRGGHR